MVSPLMVTGEVVPASASDQATPPLELYWNFVIAEPPSEPAVKAIEAVVSPGVATTEVGADGLVRGVTDTAEEAVPLPAALMARSLIEYVVPFVSPLIVIGEARSSTVSLQVLPPSGEYS